MDSTIATSNAAADTTGPSVHGEEEPMRRSTSVFRCLFPHEWEDSSQENAMDESEAAADSHAGSQPTDDDDDTTPVMPATLPVNVSTPARDDEYNPEVPTFINDVTPEVAVSPDDPAANEQPHALADKSAAPETPATPVNSAPDVPPTPVNNASTDGDDTSPTDSVSQPSTDGDDTRPTDSVSQPPSASTTGSQARDVGDVDFGLDTMEHDEYRELVCSKAESRRIVRHSARPTIWRHHRRPKASICVYDALDNGVCLIQTGLIWSVDGVLYEVVLVSSLGWVEQKARRSHQVSFTNNPIYVVIRAAALQGTEIYFHQLRKLVAATVFREGRPSSVVSFEQITQAKQLAKQFVDKHQRAYQKWVDITYLRTSKELQALKEEAEKQARMQIEKEEAEMLRQQEKEEAMRKKLELAELKRKEVEAKRAAAAAAREIAKAEDNKRTRTIKREVKAAVLNTVNKMEGNLQAMLVGQIDTLRAEMEADMGHRIAQCEDAVENLLVTKSSLTKVKATMLKDIKTTMKDIKTKMLKDIKIMMDKRVKNMMTKKKSKPDNSSNAENVEPAPPAKRAKPSDAHVPLSMMSLPPEQKAAVSVTNDFAMCPTMSGRRTLRMTPHPSAVPRSWWIRNDMSPSQEAIVIHRQHALGTPRYMSPVFGQRNYSR